MNRNIFFFFGFLYALVGLTFFAASINMDVATQSAARIVALINGAVASGCVVTGFALPRQGK